MKKTVFDLISPVLLFLVNLYFIYNHKKLFQPLILSYGAAFYSIAAAMIIILATSGFFDLIPFLISLIFIKVNFLGIGAFLMAFGLICFIGIRRHFFLAIPTSVMERNNIDSVYSWHTIKGHWETITGLCIFLYINIEVVKKFDVIVPIDFADDFWIYCLIIKIFTSFIYFYLSTIIPVLISVVLYKKIKENEHASA